MPDISDPFNVRETWILENADGDEVTIDLLTDGESIKVTGGDGEGYSADRNEIVTSLVPKYQAQGYTVRLNYEVEAGESRG